MDIKVIADMINKAKAVQPVATNVEQSNSNLETLKAQTPTDIAQMDTVVDQVITEIQANQTGTNKAVKMLAERLIVLESAIGKIIELLQGKNETSTETEDTETEENTATTSQI